MADKYEVWIVQKLKTELIKRAGSTKERKTELVEREQVTGYFIYRFAGDQDISNDIKALTKGEKMMETRIFACNSLQTKDHIFFSGIVGAAMKNKIMETNWKLSEKEDAEKLKFMAPTMLTMTASVPLYGRLSLGPVVIQSIGELFKTSASVRKELKLEMEGSSAVFTLWGERAEQSSIIVGQTNNVWNIKAVNEFRGQRAYNSTQTTTFMMAEEKEIKKEEFEGEIESVSFESNLIEVDGDLITVTETMRKQLFSDDCFQEGTLLKGRKRKGEILTMSVEDANSSMAPGPSDV